MALHRDIYWVGRQWAVTGYGLRRRSIRSKRVNSTSKLPGYGDILESVGAERWLNLDDFEEALAVARKRFPEPPRKAALPQEKAAPPEEIARDMKEINPRESPQQPPAPPAREFDMRIENCPARFVRQWRVRIRR
jgi:hypothetical protein